MIITLWLFNIAIENGPFIVDFPIKTSIYGGFSMAMLNNQRVYTIFVHPPVIQLGCGQTSTLMLDGFDFPLPGSITGVYVRMYVYDCMYLHTHTYVIYIYIYI